MIDKKEMMETIRILLATDQFEQMVEQIDAYGTNDFWNDYYVYIYLLHQENESVETTNGRFVEIVLQYFKVKKEETE